MTGRPRKLNTDAQELIVSRIKIARTSAIFTTKQLWDGFNISEATLRRYYFPSERELSLKVAMRRYHEQVKSDRNHCYYCHDHLGTHARCKDCNILLHEEPELCHCGQYHGLAVGSYCANCAIIQKWQLDDQATTTQ